MQVSDIKKIAVIGLGKMGVDWIANLTWADVDASWFATGEVPSCPSGGSYDLDANGLVVCDYGDHSS